MLKHMAGTLPGPGLDTIATSDGASIRDGTVGATLQLGKLHPLSAYSQHSKSQNATLHFRMLHPLFAYSQTAKSQNVAV